MTSYLKVNDIIFPANTPVLEKALVVALSGHLGQTDKTGAPYIFHPMRVSYAALATGLDERSQVVALLHDVLEDTKIGYDELSRTFGGEVAVIVDVLSRRKIQAAEEATARGLDLGSNEPYEDFIARVAEHSVARRVKLLDILDNCRPERFVEGLSGLMGRYEKSKRSLVKAIIDNHSEENVRFLNNLSSFDRDFGQWLNNYTDS